MQADRIPHRGRWAGLLVLCLGVLMIVLDTTIVNVALPSIREDLHFSETSLVWVTNVYMLTFGSTLLVGGRLGDVFGRRRVFFLGILLFMATSLACGLANTRGLLVAARAVQGVAGAVVVAVALSLIMSLFDDRAERAKAVGIYGFVTAGGGSIGVVLGGVLTSVFEWHWIFFVNLPIGMGVAAFCAELPPDARSNAARGRLDIWGAVAVTAFLMLANYAIVNAHEDGWSSTRTCGLIASSAALLIAFLAIESRASAPLIPLGILKLRNFAISNTVGLLWYAGLAPWVYFLALYLQQVLGYAPINIGLAFLPMNVIMAIFSLGVSARLVTRFGIRATLATGLIIGAAGLALLARVPVDGTILRDVLPGMVLIGIGAGVAYSALLIASTSDVASSDFGLASGIAGTARIVGGALGLAVLASLSAARTSSLLESGTKTAFALTGGYRLALLVGAAWAAIAALLCIAFLRAATPSHTQRSRANASVSPSGIRSDSP